MEYERRWALLQQHVNVSALCRQFGISRKTGNKWIGRYDRDDLKSLEDRSRRPHDHPHKLPDVVVDAVLTLRRSVPLWVPPFSAPFANCNQPNDTWCADYKGWFHVKRTKCHPLTVTDAYCRELLR